ncbi:MAG TPA: GNAT family N-acetyltransferase [Gammaproteobacteria bacterium]|nr:GNAT family N-acetyltransferase [Gammaproteobacteria bacterium]
MTDPVRIRSATPADVPLILGLIRELAEYEKMLPQVTASEADLRNSLFGPKPAAECVIAEQDSRPAGFALFFHNFSTFLGKPGLYLEDLYVKPELRGKGIGRRLLSHLARLTLERGCGRFEWAVLSWNEPAIRIYQRLGAQMLDDWRINRLTGAALEKLAAG